MTDYLRCLTCAHEVEVSEEDPDASLTDAIDHQMMWHGIYDWWKAMLEIGEVTR